MVDYSPLRLAADSSFPIETSEADDAILATIKRATSGAVSAWADNFVTGIAFGGGSALTDITFAANGSSAFSFNDSSNLNFQGEASSIIEALNQGIHNLSTTTGIDLSAIGTTALYTVPTGQSAIIIGAIVRVTDLTSGSTVSSDVALGIGVDSAQGDIISSQTLTNLRALNDAFHISNTNSLLRVATAGEIISAGIDTGAVVTSGSTFEAAIDLIGYLI